MLARSNGGLHICPPFLFYFFTFFAFTFFFSDVYVQSTVQMSFLFAFYFITVVQLNLVVLLNCN